MLLVKYRNGGKYGSWQWMNKIRLPLNQTWTLNTIKKTKKLQDWYFRLMSDVRQAF